MIEILSVLGLLSSIHNVKIFGHLLFVFTLVQTPFITFMATKKPPLMGGFFVVAVKEMILHSRRRAAAACEPMARRGIFARRANIPVPKAAFFL